MLISTAQTSRLLPLTPILRSKSQYSAQASAAGVPAVIGGGIYPGTSNVMAAHMISISRREYDEEWNYLDTPGD